MRSKALEDARKDPQVFFKDKPDDVSFFDWLFSQWNRYCFSEMSEDILIKLKQLMQRTGKAFIFQRTLAKMFDLSDRWVRKVLAWLIDLGILIVEKIWNGRIMQNYYHFAPFIFLKPGKSSGESSYADNNPHQVNIENERVSQPLPSSENKDIKANYRKESSAPINGRSADQKNATFVGSYSNDTGITQPEVYKNTVLGVPNPKCNECFGFGMRYLPGGFFSNDMVPCECCEDMPKLE